MEKPKILAFAGSTRAGSYNKLLVKAASKGAEAAGAEVTFIDLKDYPMPLYDGDLEEKEGLPENAKKLQKIFLAHQGLLIACPEYNSGITAVLKNALDWVSRPLPNEKSLVAYENKTAALLSASPGALGGLRGLVHVRAILGNIKVLVLPDQLAVAKANEAFLPDGSLKDAAQKTAAEAIGAKLAQVLIKLTGC